MTNSSDDIAIIGWSISPMVRHTGSTEAQLLNEVISGATENAGITRADVDFTCAGSCDYVAGQAFSFVQNIDAVGAWPPKRDSHVEMDGAWALYEAWLRLQIGDIESRWRWDRAGPPPPTRRPSTRWRWTRSTSHRWARTR